MKYYSILLFILISLLVSCSLPLDEIAQEQASEGVEEICLFYGDTECWVCTGDPAIQQLSKGRYFHYHPTDDTVFTLFVMELRSGCGTIISGHIVESVKDGTFLLADRKPLDSIFGPLQTLPCPFDSSSTFLGRPKEPLSDYDDHWDMIHNAQYHDYWILNLKTSDVYGPLVFDQYLKKKEELGISDGLKLKCETLSSSR